MPHYDAILIVSFGGPEGPDDVMPFLENVLRGKPVPESRKLEVAEHYQAFGGISPINAHNRELRALLTPELARRGIHLPVLLANRNWTPYIPDVLRTCAEQGMQRLLAYVTSGFSCYSGCRQYRENLLDARKTLGDEAPAFDKIRVFYNHPLFIETVTENVRNALAQLPADLQDEAALVFTAHSIPMAMSDSSDYLKQLNEAARLVTEHLGRERYDLVFQSRSGPPQVPWLEPDICDHLETCKAQGQRAVVCSPLGFVSDHMEVLFDLDEEAAEHAAELGLAFVRAKTPGNHPRMVEMIGELIEERVRDLPERRAIGRYPANHDVCPATCCPAAARPPLR